VCVPDLIGALAVWRQNTKKKIVQETKNFNAQDTSET